MPVARQSLRPLTPTLNNDNVGTHTCCPTPPRSATPTSPSGFVSDSEQTSKAHDYPPEVRYPPDAIH